MLLKYEERIRLLAGSFTCQDELAPYGILDIFQEVAGEHAELLDMGFNSLASKNIVWLLVANKYVALKSLPLYSIVDVETWPWKKQRFDFYREYRIRDKNGEDVIHGISRWVLVDMNTRRIVIPRNDYDYQGEYCEETNFPDKIGKIKDFDITGIEPYQVRAAYSDLDHNMHVNNSRYCFFIINAIKEANIKGFEITYVKEVKLDELIDIYYIKENNTYYVKGLTNGEICFISKVEV